MPVNTIESFGLSASQLTAEAAAIPFEATTLDSVDPDAEETAETPETETPEPEPEETQETETAPEKGKEPEPPSPESKKDRDDDDDGQELDPEFIKSRVGERVRLRPKDESEAHVLLLKARNKDMTLEEAYRKVYGNTEKPTDTPAADKKADEPAKLSRLEELEAAMEEKDEEIAAAKAEFDNATEAKLEREYRKLDRERTKLLIEQKHETAASAPEVKAPETNAAKAEAALKKAIDADHHEACEEYPEWGDEKSPLRVEGNRIFAEWEKAGDPRASSPQVNSIIAKEAAKSLRLAPAWSRPAAKPQPKTLPGPAKTGGGERSESKAPTINIGQLSKQFTPGELRRLGLTPV